MSEALVERLNAAEIALRDDRPYAAVAIGEAADRIEALEAERDKQREHIRAQAEDIMTLGHLVYDDADPPVTWKMRTLTAEADKARLSEALRPFADMADYLDSETEGFADTDEFDLLYEDHLFHHFKVADFRAARAALSGSGSGWREPDGWKLVPVEPSRAHLERLASLWGYTLEETADSYAAFLDALPAAPQQGGE